MIFIGNATVKNLQINNQFLMNLKNIMIFIQKSKQITKKIKQGRGLKNWNKYQNDVKESPFPIPA